MPGGSPLVPGIYAEGQLNGALVMGHQRGQCFTRKRRASPLEEEEKKIDFFSFGVTPLVLYILAANCWQGH